MVSATSTDPTTGNALNANAESNAVTNSISNSKGGTSTGSADSTASETMVPLTAMATWTNNHTATQVSHQNGLVASTISFNLPRRRITQQSPGIPSSRPCTTSACHQPSAAAPAGAGQVFNQNLIALPLSPNRCLRRDLHRAGRAVREHHPSDHDPVHPALSHGGRDTCPADLQHAAFSVIAFIGVILLIGIVKKNGIMMIDFAIHMQREQKMEPQQAIHDAAVVRLRPIMMTTFAAILGALPLAIGIGQGASLRQPLGITVIGGLILSQIITLYTTPVIYLWFERLRVRMHTWYNNRTGQSNLSTDTP